MEKRKVIGLCISFLIIGIITGSISIVIAESINSNEVLYDNSNSSSSATDVQGAIDDVYNTLDKVGSGYSLIAHAPEGLSTELVAGLYRYQGTNVDNYICFGTTDKNTCTSDIDKYMYRIMGINVAGQLKLIKSTILSTNYQWNTTNSGNWPTSSLYNGLNGSYFLTNTTYVPNNWSDRISITTWKYGNINTPINDKSAADIAEIEDGFSNTVNAKIGLMYLSEFYYGMPGGNNCSNSGNPTACKSSWIYGNNKEWMITKYNNALAFYTYTNYPWNIMVSVYADFNGELTNTYSVRPVFYLNSNQMIVSGSGTLTDPYILGGV